MRKNFAKASLRLLTVFFLIASAPAIAQAQAAPSSGKGTVPVAIWQIEREGFPTIRHAWRIGTDVLLRVSWDSGATWYGFRPFHGDSEKGVLAVRAVKRAIADNVETWAEKFAVTIVNDRTAEINLTNETAPLRLKLRILEFRDVPGDQIQTSSVGPNEPAGKEHCCAACGQVLACNCSACIPECGSSCCVGNCYCLVC